MAFKKVYNVAEVYDGKPEPIPAAPKNPFNVVEIGLPKLPSVVEVNYSKPTIPSIVEVLSETKLSYSDFIILKVLEILKAEIEYHNKLIQEKENVIVKIRSEDFMFDKSEIEQYTRECNIFIKIHSERIEKIKKVIASVE